MTFYFDKESIKYTDGKILVWEKLIPMFELTDTETGKVLDYELIKIEFNEMNQYRILDWVEYNKDGSSLNKTFTRTHIYIEPETRFEKLITLAKGYIK